MKKQFALIRLILPALLLINTPDSQAQATFELTTSRTNTMASRALIDLPVLTDKPTAIIVATLDDNQRMSNPHPMGAWYYGGKWNLFNTDHANLPIGLKFKITYYLNPGTDQFVHTVGVIESEGSYINNAKLNNNPNAKVDFLQIHGTRTNGLNPYEAEVFYSTRVEKWCIRNKGGHELTKNASYNIVVSSTGSTPETTTVVTTIAPAINPLITAGPLPAAPSAWAWNGNNIHNTNSGFVGIGNNNPAYRLDVAGPMLVRSSGATTGSAGIWLNNDYNHKTALIGMENDNHVGFFGVGINKWFSMNTNTGALKINGSVGKPGQVLVSNGAESPAYKGIGNVIKTEMKKGTVSIVAVAGVKTDYYLSEISHTFTLTAKSKIIISAKIIVGYRGAYLQFDRAAFMILLKSGTVIVYEEGASLLSGMYIFSMCNYIIELEPGTHTLAFYSRDMGGQENEISPKYSSIIILPVD